MKKKILGVNKSVIFLGIVSLLTDISSEIIFSVFSIFFTIILGASTFILGIIEGLADFSASSLDYVSGFLSDRSGRRKPMTILGYLFSTVSKFLLVISSSITSSAIFRVVERLGKSLRGPPRDAWISSLSTNDTKGYAFGLHKAFDKTGAIFGPLIAFIFFLFMPQNLRSFKILFIIAFLFAVCSTIILLFIKDKHSEPKKRENIFFAYKTLDKRFKNYLIAAAFFSLAYFSFSFLLLKAYKVGFSLQEVILLYSLFNISFVLLSIPIGKLGDKIGRSKIIMLSYILYFIMALGFVFANSKAMVIVLFIIFGIFYTIDEGQTKAFVTDLEPSRKATAIGFYNFVTGLIYLPASVIAGYLWKINSSYAFLFAALLSLFALIIFICLRKKIEI